jgi:hypothetical protein
MANTSITWETLLKVLNHAGVIIGNDDQAVYFDVSGQTEDRVRLFNFHSNMIQYTLRREENPQVEICGSSAWVRPVGSAEADLQLSFYHTWIIQDEDLDTLP